MRVVLLPEAGKLQSHNLILSAATVKADDSAMRNDREESDSAELGAELADCSVSVGEMCWVLRLRVQAILLVILQDNSMQYAYIKP